MFKVLVIAYYYPPIGLSGVQRTMKFTKYLGMNNWEPTVLTTTDIGYYAHDYSLLDEAKSTSIKIIRASGKGINTRLSKKGTIKMPPEIIRKVFSRLNSTIFIPDNKIGWCKQALNIANELLTSEKFDLIFVSGPPFSSFIMATELKKKFNLPLVLDYRDLWYGNQFGFYPTPLHNYLHKKMEYKVLKTADSVIVTNRRIKEKLLNNYKFLTFKDVSIIPHGYDPQDFENLLPEKRNSSRMNLTYTGIFYEFITPKYFLRAFKQLSIERPDIAANIRLHFVGLLRNENVKLIRQLELQEFVKEHGYLNHKDALIKTVSSDVLWMMVGNGRNTDTISSGKLFEYFGSKKPIIACLSDGALKNALLEYGASFFTEPDNIEQIKNIIFKVYELFVTGNLPLPNEDFINKHRRDFLTEQLVKQFQFLVKTEVQ
ncbi:MAG TPA: glycosyltransferase [Ignavibacteriaceae bacterium]|nr:glycosyltransferase [Ignavibacteriaceae bacterium]